MDFVEELKTENSLLKNELRSLNSEMSQLLLRTKTAEKGRGLMCHGTPQILNLLGQYFVYLVAATSP
jgi:hypothetical protein